ncbi:MULTISPECIES: hypothetical protein [Methylorubrum]|uniref:Uncharacterized protein n=2 Tax=Methylorubrum TaxID=2282523 RepID=C5B1N5_METEA|nr:MULTISPECIES: hypothetical protein [Methylorubrum]MBY0144054.1 hypothetical protein [Methylorubrum populi]ACS39669.1 Hypothetical protein MexAM1_META1p1827 [Methylorubrum extorquens AM1]MBK3403950.1 hypothetical protein [Methylorubrum rhodesianum]MCP1542209.1 hypothetical protein [Methylorubrum extorquens]MCP1590446.1 hypothetical protein [Methylorubrum extorquens]
MPGWQDTTLSSPLYALMREMADDLHPEYNELPESHPDVQVLRAECMKALQAGRRAAGAAKAAQTRAKNAEKGITQVGLKGSTKQKRWASELRGAMLKAAGGDAGFASLVEHATASRFWIDNRKVPWSTLVARFLAVKAETDAAAAEAQEIMSRPSYGVDPGNVRRLDALYAVQCKLDRFLGE